VSTPTPENTPTPVSERSFALDDQLRFAALSGDHNPIHVDPVLARRTLVGAPIVHGLHLVLWALEHGLLPGELLRLSTLEASFPRPTHLGTKVTLTRLGRGELEVASRTGPALRLAIGFGTAVPAGAPAPPANFSEREAPLEVGREVLAEQSGELLLGLDPSLAAATFPRLAAELPSLLFAELVGLTRLVGMRCPGLHSLFTGFRLSRHDGPRAPTLAFSVKRANLKYSLVELGVRGPYFEGSLETFARPSPRPSLAMTEVKKTVEPFDYASVDALVVGGTRGLGEAFAKVIAAGGGRVVLSYHRGSADAERVCSEIRAAGGQATTLELDVLAAPELRARWPVSWPPRYLFYLATPFITVDRERGFDAEQFELLARYYVSAFERVLAAARALGGEPLAAWAPSTTFLDSREPGTEAYCAAKAAMEELGRRLSAGSVRVIMPRLPRVRTDQTVSLTLDASLDALAVAVRELSALVKGAASAAAAPAAGI
jgi:NAD(P)-dependent dehydrogenase (short-subunit alcohol dehydrogenase family)